MRSVQKAFERIGAQLHVATTAEEIGQATKLVLPGVGAFGAGMAALHRHCWVSAWACSFSLTTVRKWGSMRD